MGCIQIGGCCGDFRCDWVIKPTGIQPMPSVRRGLHYAYTVAELNRGIYTRSGAFAAIKEPLRGDLNPLVDGGTFPLLCSSHPYPPSVRRLKMSMSMSPLADDLPDRDGLDCGSFLFVRLLELPFASPLASGSLNPEDPFWTKVYDENWEVVGMLKLPAESSAGFYAYECNLDGPAIIFPSQDLLGVVAWIGSAEESGFVLKPRPSGWGGGVIANYFRTGTWLAFSKEPKSSIVVRPKVPTWRSVPSYRNSTRAGFRQVTYVLDFHDPPLDGDTVTMDYPGISVTKTWRTTISDPATQIKCFAFDPDNFNSRFLAARNSIAQYMATASESGTHPYRDAVFGLIGNGVVSIPKEFRIDIIPKSSYDISSQEPNVISTTGNVKTSARFFGKDFDWRPLESSVGKGTYVPESSTRSTVFFNDPTMMAIPLSSDYSKTIDIPEFSRPFIVEVFLDPLLSFDFPGPNARQYRISFSSIPND